MGCLVLGDLGVNDSLRLAELLAIRLCHDLSSPLGTLMGSLEMLNEDPETAEEALALANEVSATLGKRLRLFRAAWGGAAPALRIDEFATLATGLPQGRRVTVNLDRLTPTHGFPPNAARLALNVLMLAAESLPSGGVVTLAGDPQAEMQITISGPRAAWPAGLAAFLVDDARAWAALMAEDIEASRTMQGPLTALIARAAGIRLSMLMASDAEAAPPLLLAPTN